MPHLPGRKRQEREDDQHRVWPREIQQRGQSEERCEVPARRQGTVQEQRDKARDEQVEERVLEAGCREIDKCFREQQKDDRRECLYGRYCARDRESERHDRADHAGGKRGDVDIADDQVANREKSHP